eukprot:c41287_g1_i1 orf=1-195(-)
MLTFTAHLDLLGHKLWLGEEALQEFYFAAFGFSSTNKALLTFGLFIKLNVNAFVFTVMISSVFCS